MPARRTPTDKPEVLNVTPLRPLQTEKKLGRPRKITLPPPPNFTMEDYERTLYQGFIDSILEDYGSTLRASDRIMLPLVGAEFILYLRTTQQQLAANEVISQARQHPATNFRAMLDQILATTRKARLKAGDAKQEDDDWTPNLWKKKDA